MRMTSPIGRPIALALVAAGLTLVTLQVASAQPQPGRTYKVGFSQLVDHPALNATRQGFIDGLKADGFEIGKNLNFDYQNAQGRRRHRAQHRGEVSGRRVDLLAPCTTPVVQATIRVAKDSKTPRRVRLRHQPGRGRRAVQPRQTDRHQRDRASTRCRR